MSTTSKVPSIQRSNSQISNFFKNQPTPKRTFVIEELYTHDEENSEYCDVTPQTYIDYSENPFTIQDPENDYYEVNPEETNRSRRYSRTSFSLC